MFRVLGQFIAKGLMDSRIIDVAFSRTFMKLVLDHELPLTIPSVKVSDIALNRITCLTVGSRRLIPRLATP